MASQRVLLAARCAALHPHDFTIQYPVRREYFKENYLLRANADGSWARAPVPVEAVAPGVMRSGADVFDLLSATASNHKDIVGGGSLGLYVHVPFCASKCSYCNFAVDTRSSEQAHTSYISGIERVLQRLKERLVDEMDVSLSGIDIGGGTPTILSLPLLERLLGALAPFLKSNAVKDTSQDAGSSCNFLSIETTPSIAAKQLDKMILLRERGVQRISVGVQSTSSRVLASLNRVEQIETFNKAMSNLREAKFQRVCADIIFGLPGQTVAQWRDDLLALVDAGLDTITTYDCLYRGKGRAMSRRTAQWPTMHVYGELYDTAYTLLTARGYHAPYGSLNFTRHAGTSGVSAYFESRLVRGEPYVGVGTYATSMLGSYWAFAPYSVDEWLQATAAGRMLPAANLYQLPAAEHMAKHVLLALSFGAVDGAVFRQRFGVDLDTVYADSLAHALQLGLLRRCPSSSSGPVSSSDRFLLAEGCFAQLPLLRALFYPLSALAWLAALR